MKIRFRHFHDKSEWGNSRHVFMAVTRPAAVGFSWIAPIKHRLRLFVWIFAREKGELVVWFHRLGLGVRWKAKDL